MQTNPDTRPLPPGWHHHFDPDRQSWYYVQINVLPPKVSYTHPASLTLDPSRPPGPLEKPSLPRAEAPSALATSSIQSRTPTGFKLSTAQQLYAGAINKQKSSSLAPEALHGPKSPVLLTLNHASSSSMASPVFSFPDLSWRDGQQTDPMDLYNMAVVVQRGGATSSSRRANQDSGQLRVPSPLATRSDSVQSSSPPQDFPAQPNRASTLTSVQLDRQNGNVVMSRLGEAPTIAMMTAPPPFTEQKSHPNTLISPPLYATFPPPTSTAPISPPTYHQSGRNQQSLGVAPSHAPPTYHPAPDQTHQQLLTILDHAGDSKSTTYTAGFYCAPVRNPESPTLQTQTQAQPFQYQHQSQYIPSPNLIQSQVPPSAQHQGIIPGSRGHALQYSQPPDQTQPDSQGIALQQHDQSSNQAQSGPQRYPPLYSQPLSQAQPPQHSQPHQAQLTGSANQTQPGLQGHQAQPGMQGHALQHGHAPQYAQPPHQAQPVPQGYASQYVPPNQVQASVQGYAPQYQSPKQPQAGIQPQYSQSPNQPQAGAQGYAPQYSQSPNQAQASIQSQYSQTPIQTRVGTEGYPPQYSQTPNQMEARIQPQYIPTPNQAQAGMQPHYSQAPNQVQTGMQLALQGTHNKAPTSDYSPIGGAAHNQGYTQQPQYHSPNQPRSTMPQQQPLYQVQSVDIYDADYGEVLTDASVPPAYVSFDETQVTVVDTWCGDGQVGYDSQTGVDGFGDSFTSLSSV